MFKSILVVMGMVVLVFADGPVRQTGQTVSYDSSGNVVTDGSIKDDAYYKAGYARAYSRSLVGVVTDTVTGLQWQDNENIPKPWISANAVDNSDTSGDTATTYCNELSLDGGGWRLPSLIELQSIVDYGRPYPSMINPVFQNNGFNDHWTADSYEGSETHYRAYVVQFYTAFLGSADKSGTRDVRCVRAQMTPSNFSRNDTTGIVTNHTDGLQWKDDVITSAEAIDYCENLSVYDYDDWRLPNINELVSLIDNSQPAYADRVSSVFENIVSGAYYISSTTVELEYYENLSAYNVNFNSAISTPSRKDASANYVLCVRGGYFTSSVLLSTDFTGNGSNDLLWHETSSGAVRIMGMNSMTPATNITVVESSNTNLIPKGIGDFNGDSKPDILVHNQNTGMARAWLMDGTSRTANIALLNSSNTNLQIAGVGDFDRDGDNDIATFNANSGSLIVWVMDGTTKLRNETVVTGANLNLAPKGVGDMNNDGIPDIVLRNSNSGAVRVWTMNNDFTRKGNEYVTGSSNTNLELRGVVDIDGDGNSDILNYNTNTGRLRAWLMDGSMGINENAEVVQDSDLDWSVRN